jgi:Tfp pilus assembly protein PilO
MNAKQFFFVLVALVVILGGGIGATVYFGNKLLAGQANHIAEARADEELIEQKKEFKKELQKKINEVGELQTLAEKFLPDSKNQEELVVEFYNIAKAHNIQPNGIAFNDSGAAIGSTSQTLPLKDTKNVLVFPFKVQTFTTSFENLIAFLKDIESNRRKLQITNIELQPTKEGQLNVNNITIEAYIKGGAPAPKTVTGAAGAKP